ncbi:protein of unknown function [Pedococcus cremeus]|uniref:DUF222 domain-containing protein n=1 Tax=Pedococcus cremeus TaxID=587636 RepID=A0A1H9XN07_9MICO|nr:protein of unknown function [Pedococcus cremeus]
MEAVKHACSGAQATVAVAFDSSQREVQAAAGVPARQRGRGVAAQVALARREPPSRGSRHLGLAKALHTELPGTGEHLRHGRVSEWRATIVARETACLSVEDRLAVDAALAADLPFLSDREVEARAKALAVQVDAGSVVARAAKARADRRVWLRPAPDTMTYLTALLPVEQGVAAYAALKAAAGTARVAGGDTGGEPDTRGEGQVMADTLVERLTGQVTAAAVPLEVQLVMPAETLVGEGDEPATLPGGHPVPAAFARHLVSVCADACERAGLAVALRRLFTSPDASQLVAMDSRRRVFDGQLRRFLTVRDQACRTPVVRRPDPPRRPCDPRPRGRPHQCHQRPRAVPGLQPGQRSPRLECRHRRTGTQPQSSPRASAPRAHQHPHRAHLRLHRPTAAAHPRRSTPARPWPGEPLARQHHRPPVGGALTAARPARQRLIEGGPAALAKRQEHHVQPDLAVPA